MDLLCKLFYTVFSMAAVSVFIMPVILLMRLILHKAPKKYIVYMWLLYFVRGICPVSVSSPFCLVKKWNRKFHMLLAQLGLEINDNAGIMKGWLSVFIHEVSADRSYIICTLIWCAGTAGILLFTLVRQAGNRMWLSDAANVYERVYQTSKLKEPLITGVCFLKMYLPSGTRVNDIKYLLQHFEAHSKSIDGIKRVFAFIVLAVQWFNPFIWLAYYLLTLDIEMAADEAVVKKNGGNSANGFAQELFNLDNGSFKGRQTLLFFNEKYAKKRAERLIYLDKSHRQYSLLALVTLFLCFTWIFLLRPLQILWNGGTWGTETRHEEDRQLFSTGKEVVVASLDTVSPSGLVRRIQLVMTSGSYEKGKGYTGSFELKLNDTFNSGLGQADISYIFNDVPKGQLYFGEGTELFVYDYNADGINELVIGQQADVTNKRWREVTGMARKKNSVLKEYHIWNVGEMSFERIEGAIYDTSKKEAASCKFNIPEKTTGVFSVKHLKKTVYYIWNQDEEKYKQKEMTKEELEKYRTDYTNEGSTEGEEDTHTLDSGDTTYVEIVTKKDTTGNEAIKQIILNPGKFQRKMPVIKGYFCDIQWAEEDSKRYAVLIYNGLRTRTFTVYDLNRQKVYYAHEDGNSTIASVFKNYNDTNIVFNEKDPVVYKLENKNGDNLEIGFATNIFVANTKDNITINGSYVYNVISGGINNFSYSQNVN